MRSLALLVLLAGCASTPSTQRCGGRVDLHNIWTTLAARYDKDGDGQITAAEFTRGDKQFKNHDRDADGVITAADYPAGRFWNGFGPSMARRMDRDKDGAVTRQEWQALIQRLDVDRDGLISDTEFGKMWKSAVGKADLIALSFDQDGSGRIETADFESLFADMDRDDNGELDAAEMRGNKSLFSRPKSKLPKKGELAADFDLPRTDDPKQTIRLSSFRGQRPVALIFGSYT